MQGGDAADKIAILAGLAYGGAVPREAIPTEGIDQLDARDAGVRTLVLNHPVPAPLPGTEPEWIAEAKAHFDGEVLLATDLLKVEA